jgi:hypothetical protein
MTPKLISAKTEMVRAAARSVPESTPAIAQAKSATLRVRQVLPAADVSCEYLLGVQGLSGACDVVLSGLPLLRIVTNMDAFQPTNQGVFVEKRAPVRRKAGALLTLRRSSFSSRWGGLRASRDRTGPLASDSLTVGPVRDGAEGCWMNRPSSWSQGNSDRPTLADGRMPHDALIARGCQAQRTGSRVIAPPLDRCVANARRALDKRPVLALESRGPLRSRVLRAASDRPSPRRCP